MGLSSKAISGNRYGGASPSHVVGFLLPIQEPIVWVLTKTLMKKVREILVRIGTGGIFMLLVGGIALVALFFAYGIHQYIFLPVMLTIWPLILLAVPVIVIGGIVVAAIYFPLKWSHKKAGIVGLIAAAVIILLLLGGGSQ